MNLAKYISHKKEVMVQMFFNGELIGEVQPLIPNKNGNVYEIGSVLPRSFFCDKDETINRSSHQR